MAKTLVVGVSDLLTEFLADALVFLGTLQAAGAITTGTLQAIFYGLYYFCIFIESDCHKKISFFFLLYTACQEYGLSALSSFLFNQLMIQCIKYA